ncbi:Serrate RNA effector molecule-like protein [Psilocybe cubensis]|uniref:C2H2-type domain-containing protein n=2 Tax=Psilocybe cubensis TaxID=181762 RepID=A0A8H7XZH9_PSICU|nr:Serrate RNA effector molecule-like protein [Psilocybe cubensis]KAH9483110.1 Serrate RNA effector molecule-like protein [Psilocybe cubensis]
MSSWSSSYPPPPRRSRSRSPPSRGYSSGRPPYSDTYSENYRPDWDGRDTYDRDRWHDRERPYDYGRRGRSRSPPVDETGRKRRRSMSPYDRERYDPRPRYNDDYDGHSRHGYSSPRRHQPYPPSRRSPPDPHTFDFPATLKQYADWFRYFYPTQAMEEDNADKAAEQEAGDGSKPRNGIRSRWEKYKKEFAANQLQTMFEHHRKSPWFAEKYDPAPEFESLRARVRKEGWKGRLNSFLDDLESGKFDPNLREPEAEPSSPVKESANGDAAPADDTKAVPSADDDMQFNVDGDEDAGDQEANRPDANGKTFFDNKRGNRGEEVSVEAEGNQVMIRTIPPDIGRVKLEEACSKVPGYVYLALGDPLQKRNYYRAGWLRFRDDADMAAVVTELSEKKIEGFKLHVTHNTRPFVNKVRYTPEVASRPERLEKDLENAKTLAGILEEQAAKLRAMNTSAPPVSANKNGDASKAEDQDAPMAPPVEEEEPEPEPEPRESGSAAVERRIEKVMTDMREQGLVDANDEKAYREKKVVVSLDLYLAYLRAAFHTCYYCAVVTDHLEELQRKCLKHERKPLSKALLEELKLAEAEKEKKNQEQDQDKEMPVDGAEDKTKVKEKEKENGKVKHDSRDWKRNDERWLEWLDSKVALLINRDGVDPRAYGGKSYEEELSKAVEPFLKQEDEGKFRCKTCQKLFKATSFVEKHIANKHPELVKSLDEIPYFNNFALDPHRIQPFAHPPATVGNSSQAPPPQAYGIQGPSPFHAGGGDYGRGIPYFAGNMTFPPGGHPPYYWDPSHPAGYPPGMYPARRDDTNSNRRLSDRISGFAPESAIIPAAAGLPPKPTPAALDSALVSGNPAMNRRNNRNNSLSSGPPPPPPPDAKEDPRAAGGKRVSYHDMDLVAEGDVELMY